eukprot:TRINITY_DN4939_c1_g1_i1.p1 TRINITY_DN4939_c1_g1~~TRINITY_DN4939_c1_g1_i1.p1  ORF type:complete len:418 (-),score=101.65 TRINITY_DN4939_c1_g1_i1:117-1370(-)
MSLDSNTIQIIKSTVPVLKEHGLEIVTNMYGIMFSEHPEVRQYFNMANQNDGTVKNAEGFERLSQRQTLTNAVFAYASNIDNLGALGEAVERMAHKHCALMIQPEHYAVVGASLLKAIKKVLGDAATDEIMTAWEKAYGLLAQILIKTEGDIYEAAKNQEGGWKGVRKFTVSKRIQEAEDVVSLQLVPEDGGALPTFLPGQFCTVKLDVKDEQQPIVYRNYTISSPPNVGYLQISVKREPAAGNFKAGLASNHIHDNLKQGDVVLVGPPMGPFHLKSEKPEGCVFLSAGIGITPMVSMLNHMKAKGDSRKVYFIHGTSNSSHYHLHDQVDSKDNVVVHQCFSKPLSSDVEGKQYHTKGRVTMDVLKSVLPLALSEYDYYVCGPTPFMKDMIKGLEAAGVKKDHVNFECFGPHVPADQ